MAARSQLADFAHPHAIPRTHQRTSLGQLCGDQLPVWHRRGDFREVRCRPVLLEEFVLSDASNTVFFPHATKERRTATFPVEDQQEAAAEEIRFEFFLG